VYWFGGRSSFVVITEASPMSSELPNLSLNADVPQTWAAPTGGPPVSLFR